MAEFTYDHPDKESLLYVESIEEAAEIVVGWAICYEEVKTARPHDYREVIKYILEHEDSWDDVNLGFLCLPDSLGEEGERRTRIIKSLHKSDELMAEIFHNRITYQELSENCDQEQVDIVAKRFRRGLRRLKTAFFNPPAVPGNNEQLPNSTNTPESKEPKKSLKIGVTLPSGEWTDVVRSFYFLKEDLRFFLKDLPFTLPLPPTEPEFDISKLDYLREFTVGMVMEDGQHNSTEDMVSTRLIRAIANANGFVLRNSLGASVEFGDIAALFYLESEIKAMASAKWDQYSQAVNLEVAVFEASIMQYIQAMTEWEWAAFYKARDVADQVHWGRGVTLDGITQATKETGLNPILPPDRLTRKIEDAEITIPCIN